MQQLALLAIFSFVVVQLASAQLPLRIDVTWFERHDVWKRRNDAFYDDAKAGDAPLNDAASDEGETDRHSQQVSKTLTFF